MTIDSDGRTERSAGVVLALTACQRQCRADAAELFYDCLVERGCPSGEWSLCLYRCQLARNSYIARCDALEADHIFSRCI